MSAVSFIAADHNGCKMCLQARTEANLITCTSCMQPNKRSAKNQLPSSLLPAPRKLGCDGCVLCVAEYGTRLMHSLDIIWSDSSDKWPTHWIDRSPALMFLAEIKSPTVLMMNWQLSSSIETSSYMLTRSRTNCEYSFINSSMLLISR